MKASEIKAMSTADIIVQIFYLGIMMSDERGTKADDKDLERLFKELESRGVIEDGRAAYEDTQK